VDEVETREMSLPFRESAVGLRETPRFSVIIPCYNAASTLSVQLDALATQVWDEPWEILVADNGSTDRTRAILEDYRTRLPQLRVVDASARRGQPYALNTAAAASRAEFIAFVDADDEVGDGWVAAMGKALVGGRDFVAGRFDMVRLNAPWVRATRDNLQAHGLMHLWYPPYLPFAGGCGLGVRRTLHDTVGGFDEALTYVHDTDYCVKIQLAGIKLSFVEDALLHIRLRDTYSGIFRQCRLWAEYNVALYARYREQTKPDSFHPWRAYGRAWWDVLRLLLDVRDRGTLGRFVGDLGWQLGRLRGTLKYWAPPV
jgi:glycosyltransferase involved in cell wall biosynthesis